jgi:hypothetical protein
MLSECESVETGASELDWGARYAEGPADRERGKAENTYTRKSTPA